MDGQIQARFRSLFQQIVPRVRYLKIAMIYGICSLILTSCALPNLDRRLQANLLLEYRRSGGFAGLDEQLTIQSDGSATLRRPQQQFKFQVTPETLQQLQELLENTDFRSLQSHYTTTNGGADLLTYTIQYESHTVEAVDTAVPDSLWPILELLNEVIAQANP